MNVKTVVKIVALPLVAVVLMLGAIGTAPTLLTGQVVGLQPGTSLYIVNSALNCKPFFETLTNGNLVMFLGPTGNGYGWVTLRWDMTSYQVVEALTGTGGNLANGETTSALVKDLLNMGWTKLPAKEVKLGLQCGSIGAGVAWLLRRVQKFATDYLTNKGVQ